MEEKVLRVKMRVLEVAAIKNEDGSTLHERVGLTAVHGPEGSENAKWSRWTPSAHFTITISNPEKFGTLSSGHEFFLDFIHAEPVPGEITIPF